MVTHALRPAERSHSYVAVPVTPSGSLSVAVTSSACRGRVGDRVSVPASSWSVIVTSTSSEWVLTPSPTSTVTS